MPDTVNGLPTHVLLVHAVVVLVPLAALLLVLAAAAPGIRARLGGALPLLAAGCLLLVPVTTSAGERLREAMGGGGPLVDRHAELAETVLPWVAGLVAVSVAIWLRGRREAPAASRRSRGRLDLGLLALAVVVAAGAATQVARAGEAGSRSVWEGVATSQR